MEPSHMMIETTLSLLLQVEPYQENHVFPELELISMKKCMDIVHNNRYDQHT